MAVAKKNPNQNEVVTMTSGPRPALDAPFEEKREWGLQRLRESFPANQIGILPKPIVKADASSPRFMCVEGHPQARQASVDGKYCGGKHVASIHLDYVGHAALTDRLLEADIEWTWEPLAFDERGLPRMDQNDGMWIRLTVQGVTRLGYGDAQGKRGANAVKEAIGDALRNAAMRFGAALDLWHKGDLHDNEEARGSYEPPAAPVAAPAAKRAPAAKQPANAPEAPAEPQPEQVPDDVPMYRATPGLPPVDWEVELGMCNDRDDLNQFHGRAVAEEWLSPEVISAMKDRARALGIAPKGAN